MSREHLPASPTAAFGDALLTGRRQGDFCPVWPSCGCYRHCEHDGPAPSYLTWRFWLAFGGLSIGPLGFALFIIVLHYRSFP